MPEIFSAHSEKGMALVLALLTISFLTAMTVRLIADVDSQIDDVDSIHNNLAIDNALDTGMSFVMAALHSDQQINSYDSYHDIWAQLDLEIIQKFTSDVLLKIEITDLTGLLSVNALLPIPPGKGGEKQKEVEEGKELAGETYQLWKRFLLSGRFMVADEQEAIEILDCILDWLDEDDEQRPYGAENAYYQSLPVPYSCKNGLLEDAKGMAMVKGITPQLLHGDDEHDGIINFIAAIEGDGKINLNTAPVEIMTALFSLPEQGVAEDMKAYREEETNREQLESSSWYKDVIPGDITINDSLLSVSSLAFKIKITASTPSAQKIGEGILLRGSDNRQKLVRWYVD